MTNSFGKLVAAKLIERGMSQRRLARMIGRSPSYVNYLVRGTSPMSAKKGSRPSVEIVKAIAATLGIPPAEALEAAGYDPVRYAPPTAGDATKVSEEKPMGDDVFDIAYAAAVKAINMNSPAPTRKERIRIELSDSMHLMLINGGNKLSGEEVARYKRAFLAAYQALNVRSLR
jgi:transcriptional regulator with XRE-family HTH domain